LRLIVSGNVSSSLERCVSSERRSHLRSRGEGLTCVNSTLPLGKEGRSGQRRPSWHEQCGRYQYRGLSAVRYRMIALHALDYASWTFHAAVYLLVSEEGLPIDVHSVYKTHFPRYPTCKGISERRLHVRRRGQGDIKYCNPS
jgi:hypothetical protein